MNDRYMLNWLSTDIETGKYSFGFKIANFINLIFVATVGMSFMPSVFSKEKEENNTRYYRKMLTYYCFSHCVYNSGIPLFLQRSACPDGEE